MDRCMLSRSLSICVRAVPKYMEALARAPALLGPSVAYLRQSSASLFAAKDPHENFYLVVGQIEARAIENVFRKTNMLKDVS